VIAALINCLGVLAGSLVGLGTGRFLPESARKAVFTGAGFMSLAVGILMTIKTQRILHLALALVAGGLIGQLLRIEDRIDGLGHALHRIVEPGNKKDQATTAAASAKFARGFLEASVLFCVGSMAILGSINAGTTGDMSLILTKTVMDSFMALFLAASLGVGVAFSSLSILVYQGAITLAATAVAPYLTPLVIASISGTGGVLVMMIGFNLVGLTKVPTGNFLVSLVIAVGLAYADPFLPSILRS